jgi:UTP--glucose-1-phosphate uridylyltransferase
VPRSEVSHYGIVDGTPVRDGLFRVDRLVEKPKAQDAPSDYAIIGRYILTPDVYGILGTQKPGVGGEIQLTDALNTLARLRPVYAMEIQGDRFDTGDKMGFLKATVHFALKRGDLSEEFRTFLQGVLAQGSLNPESEIPGETVYANR